MLLLKRLFAAPPDSFALRQRHDIDGLLAALGHRLPWVRRDAAQSLGHMHEPRARAPLTAALTDSDADVRGAAQAALAHYPASQVHHLPPPDAVPPPLVPGGSGDQR